MRALKITILIIAALLSLFMYFATSFQFVAAVLLIVLGFSALVAYSFWFLFVSNEAVFALPDFTATWHNVTQTRTFMPAQGTAYETDESRIKLKQKLDKLKARRRQLLNELEKKYDRDKLRELNIVCNHIDVAKARLNGAYNCPEANLEDINTHVVWK